MGSQFDDTSDRITSLQDQARKDTEDFERAQNRDRGLFMKMCQWVIMDPKASEEFKATVLDLMQRWS